MESPNDDTVMTIIPMNANNDLDDAPSNNGVILRHQDAPAGREKDDERTDDVGEEVIAAEDDHTLMQPLLREAADDQDQPSLDQWLVFGFSSDAVETAYQAGQAPARAMGVVAGVPVSGFNFVVFAGFGNAESAMAALGVNSPFPVFMILLLITLAPMTYKMLQAWKPVKHCDLIYTTSCAVTAVICLLVLTSLAGLVFNQGHDISRPEVMGQICRTNAELIFVLVLLRPSPRLVIATCAICALDLSAIGYYTKTFETTTSPTIVAGIFFFGAYNLIAFVVEKSNRISFVHQLSANVRCE